MNQTSTRRRLTVNTGHGSLYRAARAQREWSIGPNAIKNMNNQLQLVIKTKLIPILFQERTL